MTEPDAPVPPRATLTREQVAEAIRPNDWKRRDDASAPAFRAAADENLRAADRILELLAEQQVDSQYLGEVERNAVALAADNERLGQKLARSQALSIERAKRLAERGMELNRLRPLRGMQQRARAILDAGIEFDPQWRRAARHILGEAVPAPTGRPVRLPCHEHDWHEVDEVEAARIVAAMSAHIADQETDPTEPTGDFVPPVCPREALGWSRDPEMYAEHTESALISAEIIRIGLDGEEAVPRAERTARTDGEALA